MRGCVKDKKLIPEVVSDVTYPGDSREPLVAFLYLLMRDKLPTGEVVALINEVREMPPVGRVFTNTHLEAMAREYADRLHQL